jgi:hypothetical protein
VLDRNGNGVIDDGREMFGNFTAQPTVSGQAKNGFLALTELDQTIWLGNQNGSIDSGDFMFLSLRLWFDANHNGVSEPDELVRLGEAGVTSLSLDYKEAGRIDRFGNRFRYRAKVSDAFGFHVGRWAWDVFPATR